MTGQAQVACFSYLAAVQTLHVDHFPQLNYGVDINRVEQFLAGDGPLVAGFLAALGHHVELLSNQVGNDAAGHHITATLKRWNVNHTPGPIRTERTRVNIVASDAAGNRTWFSRLKGIEAELKGLDATLGVTSPVVYVDCYEVLGQAPEAVLTAALDAGSDVILNLGGSPPPSWLQRPKTDRRPSVLQTNADEHQDDAAQERLQELLDLDIADLVIVTAGREGAVAGGRDGSTGSASAIAVNVHQVQGAGAAFSAGFIHSRLRGDSLDTCLAFACASGSRWCARATADHLPTEDEIAGVRRPEHPPA